MSVVSQLIIGVSVASVGVALIQVADGFMKARRRLVSRNQSKFVRIKDALGDLTFGFVGGGVFILIVVVGDIPSQYWGVANWISETILLVLLGLGVLTGIGAVVLTFVGITRS